MSNLPIAPHSPDVDRSLEIMKAANTDKPTPATLAALRSLFDAQPGLWHALGDLTRRTQTRIIDETFNDALSKEALDRYVADLQAQLGYDGAPPIERLIIDQIVTDYLRLFAIGAIYRTKLAAGVSTAQANYFDRSWARAERRYLGALETLARVRRLVRPRAVQINIGAQQVNIAQLKPD